MQIIESEKAFLRGVRLKLGNSTAVGIVEIAARLTPKIAEQLGARYTLYDNKDLPKEFKCVELESELRNCNVKLDIGGVAKYHLPFRSNVIDHFKIVRVGGKKKAKSTYLALRCNAQVSADHADAIWDYAKKFGAAEGKLTIEVAAEPEQQQLPTATATADQAKAAAANAVKKAKQQVVTIERKPEPEPEPNFLARMEAAKTTDEGRAIIREHELAIAELEQQAGFTVTTCGPNPTGYRGFSVVPDKDWRASLALVKKQAPQLHDQLADLIDQGRAIHSPRGAWETLYAKSLAAEFEEPPTPNEHGCYSESHPKVVTAKYDKGKVVAAIHVLQIGEKRFIAAWNASGPGSGYGGPLKADHIYPSFEIAQGVQAERLLDWIGDTCKDKAWLGVKKWADAIANRIERAMSERGEDYYALCTIGNYQTLAAQMAVSEDADDLPEDDLAPAAEPAAAGHIEVQ